MRRSFFFDVESPESRWLFDLFFQISAFWSFCFSPCHIAKFKVSILHYQSLLLGPPLNHLPLPLPSKDERSSRQMENSPHEPYGLRSTGRLREIVLHWSSWQFLSFIWPSPRFDWYISLSCFENNDFVHFGHMTCNF